MVDGVIHIASPLEAKLKALGYALAGILYVEILASAGNPCPPSILEHTGST
jgi:hypothetical protein